MRRAESFADLLDQITQAGYDVLAIRQQTTDHRYEAILRNRYGAEIQETGETIREALQEAFKQMQLAEGVGDDE